MDGWRVDVGYPEDVDRAEKRLAAGDDDGAGENEEDADQAVADS